MKLSISLPNKMIATCLLLLSFSKNGLKLENCQNNTQETGNWFYDVERLEQLEVKYTKI